MTCEAPILEISQGDTFGLACRWLSRKTREPVDLTDSTIKVQLRSAGSIFDIELPCLVLDQELGENKGRYLVEPADTSNWPVGTLTLITTREYLGFKASIKTSIQVGGR